MDNAWREAASIKHALWVIELQEAAIKELPENTEGERQEKCHRTNVERKRRGDLQKRETQLEERWGRLKKREADLWDQEARDIQETYAVIHREQVVINKLPSAAPQQDQSMAETIQTYKAHRTEALQALRKELSGRSKELKHARKMLRGSTTSIIAQTGRTSLVVSPIVKVESNTPLASDNMKEPVDLLQAEQLAVFVEKSALDREKKSITRASFAVNKDYREIAIRERLLASWQKSHHRRVTVLAALKREFPPEQDIADQGNSSIGGSIEMVEQKVPENPQGNIPSIVNVSVEIEDSIPIKVEDDTSGNPTILQPGSDDDMVVSFSIPNADSGSSCKRQFPSPTVSPSQPPTKRHRGFVSELEAEAESSSEKLQSPFILSAEAKLQEYPYLWSKMNEQTPSSYIPDIPFPAAQLAERSARLWASLSGTADRDESSGSSYEDAVIGDEIEDCRSGMGHQAKNINIAADALVLCICDYGDYEESAIQCERCGAWQHIECYYPDQFHDTTRLGFEHFCVACLPRKLDLDQDTATNRQWKLRLERAAEAARLHILERSH